MIAENRMEVNRAFLCNAAAIWQRMVTGFCGSAKSLAFVHVRRRVLNAIEVSRRVIVCEYSITALRIGVLLVVLLAPLAAQTKSHTKATSSNPKTETFV